MALKRYSEIIGSKSFIQIHRNYVINVDRLDKIDRNGGQVIVDGLALPFSSKYKKELFRKLKRIN